MLSIDVTCQNEKCKEQFKVNAMNIKDEKIKVIEDGKQLTVTFYDCPKCGTKHSVQLDDVNTLTILKTLKSLLRNSCKKKKKALNNKENFKKINQLREDLKQMRESLNEQYSGKHFISNGEEKELIIKY